MRRPTTCRSSPRRTTSTSGSSGTGLPGADLPRDCDATADECLDLAVGGLGGLLLGLLLGVAGAEAVALGADAHLCGEGLGVVGSGVLDDVLGHAETVLGREL